MKPNTLRKLADEAEFLEELIISLADGRDIRQIATDLERSAEEFLEEVRKLSRLKEIDPEELEGNIISDVDISLPNVLQITFTHGAKGTFFLKRE